jgi:hypothetical protein
VGWTSKIFEPNLKIFGVTRVARGDLEFNPESYITFFVSGTL